MRKNRNLPWSLFIICSAFIGLCDASLAQVRTCTITGRVEARYFFHLQMPVSAVVRVEDMQGNSIKAVWSDRQGRFAINGLAPGTYFVDVSRAYLLDDRRTVVLRKGKTVRFNIVLREPPPESDCPSKPKVPPFPADLALVNIDFERSSCLGACPAYTLNISGDGSVKYVGIINVPHIGSLSYTIPPAVVRKLTKLFYRKAFFSLCRDYSVSWTDLPGTSTSIEIGGTEWTVEDYGGVGPKQLKSLNASIDRLASPPVSKNQKQ